MAPLDTFCVEPDCGNGASKSGSVMPCALLVVHAITYSTVKSPPCEGKTVSQSDCATEVKYPQMLTARTRKSDDFPAFCRPRMVTSISVALQHKYACASSARGIPTPSIDLTIQRSSTILTKTSAGASRRLS